MERREKESVMRRLESDPTYAAVVALCLRYGGALQDIPAIFARMPSSTEYAHVTVARIRARSRYIEKAAAKEYGSYCMERTTREMCATVEPHVVSYIEQSRLILAWPFVPPIALEMREILSEFEKRGIPFDANVPFYALKVLRGDNPAFSAEAFVQSRNTSRKHIVRKSISSYGWFVRVVDARFSAAERARYTAQFDTVAYADRVVHEMGERDVRAAWETQGIQSFIHERIERGESAAEIYAALLDTYAHLKESAYPIADTIRKRVQRARRKE